MLQSVRKYTQGWVATLMGTILCFAFVMWGIENYLGGSSKKHVEAKVNGKEITASQVNGDFQRMLMRLKDQIGSNFTLQPAMQQQLKTQALNNLIMQNVLIQAAYAAGFRITPQETVGMIRQMPAFQDSGRFSKNRFDVIINRMGYTKEEFISDVSQTLLLNQVASGIMGSAFVLPDELNQAIALVEQTRDIEYVIIPSKEFKKTAQVTPEQIKIYYLQNKDNFKVPAKVKLEYVELSAENLKSSIKISDKELNDYFDSNSELNRKNSSVIDKAKAALTQQKLEQIFLSASDKLTDLTYTNPNSLNEAAKALGLKINTTDYFSQQGGDAPITKNPKILAAVFNSDLLKNHNNSNLIEIGSGRVVVVRVKDYQQSSVAALADVQEKIKQLLMEKEASIQAQKKAKDLVALIKDKKDFRQVVSHEHFSVVTKQNVLRDSKNINPQVLELAFMISPLSKKPIFSSQMTNGDYVLVMVNKIVNLPIDKITEEQRSNISKLYSDTYGKLDYNSYSENQLRKAKIKTYSK